jgi:O-acetyl-ADP-ribose deacetylase (regulator of RNase III)/transcriptional regulator with XRE-family HTH domain
MAQEGTVTPTDDKPAPERINALSDLAHEFDRLRRRAARPGQLQLSVRDLATRAGMAPSSLHPYLRGHRLCPADTYEQVLRALGVTNDQLRPWLDAWERIADAATAQPGTRDAASQSAERQADEYAATAGVTFAEPSRSLGYTKETLYRLVSASPNPDTRLGFITGSIRRVRCADIWINPENTDMRMPRFEEYSVSAIIRYEGALRDNAGRVVDDRIADELERKVAGLRPVVAGAAITTGSGELAKTHGVRHIIHVAAVHGEPGSGYRQILDIGRCVTNALAEAETLNGDIEPFTILFPALGTGVGGATPEPTVKTMVTAAVDFLSAAHRPRIGKILLLAYAARDLTACEAVLDADPRLTRASES